MRIAAELPNPRPLLPEGTAGVGQAVITAFMDNLPEGVQNPWTEEKRTIIGGAIQLCPGYGEAAAGVAALRDPNTRDLHITHQNEPLERRLDGAAHKLHILDLLQGATIDPEMKKDINRQIGPPKAEYIAAQAGLAAVPSEVDNELHREIERRERRLQQIVAPRIATYGAFYDLNPGYFSSSAIGAFAVMCKDYHQTWEAVQQANHCSAQLDGLIEALVAGKPCDFYGTSHELISALSGGADHSSYGFELTLREVATPDQKNGTTVARESFLRGLRESVSKLVNHRTDLLRTRENQARSLGA